MRYRLVIFDLDGTLLDTLSDLTGATNRALARHGYPRRTPDEVRRFVGNGVARLIRRALPEDAPEAVYADVLADFRADYSRNVNVLTRPYAGVLHLLRALQGAGIAVAVNSNKPDRAVKALCEAHFGPLVDLAVGERPGVPRKPAPDGTLSILSALGIGASSALYVGDGETDIATADSAGIDCAWVSWGFRRQSELGDRVPARAFDSPDALEAFILKA